MSNNLNKTTDIFNEIVKIFPSLTQKDRKEVESLLKKMQENTTSTEKVPGSDNMQFLKGAREGGKNIPVLLSAGEELKSLIPAEMVDDFLNALIKIVKANGTMVKTQPKQNWNNGKKLGSILLAIIASSALLAGVIATASDCNKKQVSANITTSESIVQDPSIDNEIGAGQTDYKSLLQKEMEQCVTEVSGLQTTNKAMNSYYGNEWVEILNEKIDSALSEAKYSEIDTIEEFLAHINALYTNANKVLDSTTSTMADYQNAYNSLQDVNGDIRTALSWAQKELSNEYRQEATTALENISVNMSANEYSDSMGMK